ncbi:hypothetical protein Ddye_029878 [Dipteronia dyeriana]|uniref:Reverse transcriptase domain-containing protein n=1 Tax=Dipteronia dyeriana TaxID=168575 RepID=A0AAD9WL32_9ROSI|nr:hypothetical protein Ddye_029878 [Dipteronia dyeriana]
MKRISKAFSVQSVSYLDKDFTGEEIRRSIFGMGHLKASGKDGFLAVFYQKFWDSVGMEVTKYCLEVLNKSKSLEDINETVIILIPKIQKPTNMGDYRPISLCNVLYKIIIKAMTNRLRCVLGEVISETQCAFIPGRMISDNTIVGYECVNMLKRRKRKIGYMALKLDMSKAYDRVEWGFIEKMIFKLGFPEKWRNLIMNCISTVSYFL